jgi:hypothetical protein
VPLPYLSRLRFDVLREEGALPFQFLCHVGFSWRIQVVIGLQDGNAE